MLKWFEEVGENSDVVISSRVRLARNFTKYPFSKKISDDDAILMVEEVNERFKDFKDEDGKYFVCNLSELTEIEKMAMVERHLLSDELVAKKQSTGFIMVENESASIMINEEDHIRMQALVGGMNIEKAYDKVTMIDDYITETSEIAFDEKFGYLTSCPTNVGTGLRASCMVFLPALGGANKITRLAEDVSKYGVTLRGIYGDGTSGIGNIYQVSNQKTMGSTEQDIINNLKSIVTQIIKQERKRREYLLVNNYDELEDQVYRSYGVLKYTKQINSKDAMTLLSQIKFGIDTKIIEFEESFNIYQMMLAIQPYSIQCHNGKFVGSKLRDKLRAEYLNRNLPRLKTSKII